MSKEPSKPELPQIFSDEEFNSSLEKRKAHEHTLQDHDVRGARKVVRESDGRPDSTIEQRFPHIAQKLAALWPSEACALYIRSLVVMDRDTREGFPEEVLEDLMMLYQINEVRKRQDPTRTSTRGDAWVWPHRRR